MLVSEASILNFFNYHVLGLLEMKVNFYTSFDIANMQLLNMHLRYTLILHSNNLNQLSFLLSHMSICPPKKLSLFLSFPLEPFLNHRKDLSEL